MRMMLELLKEHMQTAGRTNFSTIVWGSDDNQLLSSVSCAGYSEFQGHTFAFNKAARRQLARLESIVPRRLCVDEL